MKIAVITGASSGMGLEFARAIDREEQLDELWLIARREDRLRELAATLKNKCRILTLDLSRSRELPGVRPRAGGGEAHGHLALQCGRLRALRPL